MREHEKVIEEVTPDTAVINAAGTLQLVGLAILAAMLIVMALRIMGTGPKGFASLITEVGAFLIALFIIARPNDTMTMLMHFVGGSIQPVAAPH